MKAKVIWGVGWGEVQVGSLVKERHSLEFKEFLGSSYTKGGREGVGTILVMVA